MSVNKEEIVKNVVIVGCDHIGSAIARGVVEASMGLDCFLVDKVKGKAEDLAKSFKNNSNRVSAVDSIADVSHPRIVILAVEPDQIIGVVEGMVARLEKEDVVVSVAAGVSYKKIKTRLIQLDQALGESVTVVRAMPNLSVAVCAGITALYHPNQVPQVVQDIFASVGEVFLCEEEKEFHPFTALGSSSIAFIFVALEAMADAGVSLGMRRKDARRIAAQTVFGAASLVKNSPLHTAELKDQVASPGGTTISGLVSLEENRFRYTLIEAVKQSAFRSVWIDEDDEEEE